MSKNKQILTGVQQRFCTVRAIPDNVDETRVIPIDISSAARDRHETVLNMDNWLLDNYARNPVVGYQHELHGSWDNSANPDMVIGFDTGITFEGKGENRVMVGNPKFETSDINELADKIFRKLLFGSLRAASVGFASVGQGKWVDDAEGRDTFYFAGQELHEYSIVNIPSNPEAVVRKMHSEFEGVLRYAHQQLGDKFSRTQLEKFRVCDIITLLEGRDVEIKHTDPDVVAKQLRELEQESKRYKRLFENEQLRSK